MKNLPYIALPFALLLGLVLGGWAPRSEVRSKDTELAALRKQLAQRASRAGPIGNVTELLGIEETAPDGEQEPPRRPRRRRRRPAPATAAASTSAAAVADLPTNGPPASTGLTLRAEAEPSPERPDTAARTGESPEEPVDGEPEERFTQSIERAAAAWELRVDVARSTFVANAALSEGEVTRFDTAVAAMNIRIGQSIADFAEAVEDAEYVQPEAGFRLANEVTDSIVLTYDELDGSLPDDWRRRAGEKFSMADFIDPLVAMPLAGVQERLEHMGNGMQPGADR